MIDNKRRRILKLFFPRGDAEAVYREGMYVFERLENAQFSQVQFEFDRSQWKVWSISGRRWLRSYTCSRGSWLTPSTLEEAQRLYNKIHGEVNDC